MNTRNILAGATLALGTAFVAACAAPVVAPADSPVASFARTSEGDQATKNQSCTSDNGTKTRTSAENNGAKNSCVTNPSVAFVKLPSDYVLADEQFVYSVNYAAFGANPCTAGFSNGDSTGGGGGGGGGGFIPMGTFALYRDVTDASATTFTALCTPTIGNYNFTFRADTGDYVKASNDTQCVKSSAFDGQVRECVITKARTALTVVLVPGAYFSDQTQANSVRKVWFVPFSDGCTVPADLSAGSRGIVESTVGVLDEAHATTLCPSTTPNLRFEVQPGTSFPLNDAARCTEQPTNTYSCVVTGRRAPFSLRDR